MEVEPAAVELSIVVCVLDEEDCDRVVRRGVDARAAVARGRGARVRLRRRRLDRPRPGLSRRSWRPVATTSRAVRLLRNVGKENALAAGLAAARGEVHVPMDVDLQDPPAVLAELGRRLAPGAPVVLARRRHRAGLARAPVRRVLHVSNARERRRDHDPARRRRLPADDARDDRALPGAARAQPLQQGPARAGHARRGRRRLRPAGLRAGTSRGRRCRSSSGWGRTRSSRSAPGRCRR